jgi:uncharacterized alpha-E superfamily protein
MLERANQTARIIDVKYHRHSASSSTERESVDETIHWLSLLKCCSASEAFLKRSHFNITRQNVANFLILEKDFPRTIIYCLQKTLLYLEKIFDDFWNQKKACLQLTHITINELTAMSIETMLSHGLHQYITHIINKTGEISDAIQDDLFSPQLAFTSYPREQAQ